MRAEDRLILELCRCAPDPPAALRILRAGPLDWGALVRTARRHRVAALVLDRLLNLPRKAAGPRGGHQGGATQPRATLPLPGVSPRQRRALQGIGRNEIVAVLHDNAVFQGELARMLGQLDQAGIDCVLLKGLSLNFSRLRWMGDIDLMVPQDRLVEAIDALLGLPGYRYRRMGRDGPNEAASWSERLPPQEARRVRAQATWNNEYHLLNPSTGVLVEVHHKLFQIRNPDGRFMENVDGVLNNTDLFWARRRYDPGLGCHALCPAHCLLLSCLRNAVKDAPGNDSFRLSNLVDIDNLVAGAGAAGPDAVPSAGMPWGEFTADCLRVGLAPQALFSLRLAASLLRTPVPAAVLRELRGACTPRQLRAVGVHRRCVTSLGRSSILHSKRYQALRPGAFGGSPGERLRGALLLPLWAPSRVQIAGFFGLRRNSPWVPLACLVNPLRWGWRIVRKALGR